jgi:hypothetical protein
MGEIIRADEATLETIADVLQHLGLMEFSEKDAGNDGTRLQSFIRTHLGCERPKQYCTFVGTQSLLRQTLQRAERLIPCDTHCSRSPGTAPAGYLLLSEG